MPKNKIHVLRADRFMDPTAQRHDVPTWPWRMAPEHLLTRSQLTARGLRPARQPICGQILWQSRKAARTGGVRTAYLYDVRLALPKRVPTAAQLAALGKALAARRTCPRCHLDAGYVLPTRYGACPDCLSDWEIRAA